MTHAVYLAKQGKLCHNKQDVSVEIFFSNCWTVKENIDTYVLVAAIYSFC